MARDDAFLIGMEAPEVVVGLNRIHPEIQYMKFQEYTPHALGVTEQIKKEPEISVKNLVRHHPDVGEYAIHLRRSDVTSINLRNLIVKALTRDKALVLCSKVETWEDETFHIPMLDFECTLSDKNLAKVEEFVRELDEKGVILVSGRSYHYYSFNLLPHNKWVKFMARTLLFTGFVDIRHIGHRILSGEARLRLAKIEGSERYIMTPKIVSIIE